jgi:hypothetical protein
VVLAYAGLAQTPSETLLQDWGGASDFPLPYRQSIDAFFSAQDSYRRADYSQALEILNAYWKKHPAGTRGLALNMRDALAITASKGANFGMPGCYSALLMLSECAGWRAKRSNVTPKTVRLTVVLVGHSSGIEPSSDRELAENTGSVVKHTINPALAAADGEIIRQSLWLFSEYVTAITKGGIKLDIQMLSLPNLVLPVECRGGQVQFAGLAPAAMGKVWNSMSDEVKLKTEWWFVLYPSHYPEHGNFLRNEFVTGGMGIGPDGDSPAFLIDDQWLIRKPPHLGKGTMTEGERLAYLPQWFQHEFFHHLYRTYPLLQLEPTSHSWHNRSAWPQDFNGFIETDYYAESLHKRLQTAIPPLAVALRYATPPKELLKRITPSMMRGQYRREPLSNDGKDGVIDWNSAPGSDPKQTLRWITKAGATCGLLPNLNNGRLDMVGNDSRNASFRILLRQGADGADLPEVLGFRFQHEIYLKTNGAN